MPSKLIALVFWLMLTAAEGTQAQVVVVAGAGSAQPPVSREQLARLYLGSATVLADGSSAVLLDLPPTSPTRDQFYLKVTGKTAEQVAAGWARLAFSGKGARPEEVRDAAELKRRLAQDPKALGYLDIKELDDTVRVLIQFD